MQNSAPIKQARLQNDQQSKWIAKLDANQDAKLYLMKFLQFFDLIAMLRVDVSWQDFLNAKASIWRDEYKRAWSRAKFVICMNTSYPVYQSIGLKKAIADSEPTCRSCFRILTIPWETIDAAGLCSTCHTTIHFLYKGQPTAVEIRRWILEHEGIVDTAVFRILVRERVQFLVEQRDAEH